MDGGRWSTTVSPISVAVEVWLAGCCAMILKTRVTRMGIGKVKKPRKQAQLHPEHRFGFKVYMGLGRFGLYGFIICEPVTQPGVVGFRPIPPN